SRPLTTHPKRQRNLFLINRRHQGDNLLATSDSTDRRRHQRFILHRGRWNVSTPTTTSIQVVETVVHLHERVVQDTQMGLNVLHPLSMLMHELIKAVLSRTIGGHALFQSLERLVGL